MRKKFKVLMSPLLITAMLATTLVACSGGSDSPESESSGTENKSANETTSTGSTGSEDPFSLEADNKIVDAELAEVTTPEEFANTEKFEYLFEIGNTPEPGAFGTRYFEKKFNVTLKHVGLQQENRQEQLNLMFATGTTPDLAMVSLPAMQEYAKQGLLAEIPIELIKKNMPNYYKSIESIAPGLLDVAKVDGKIMGLSRMNVVGGIPAPAAIRADWLKNVGITKVPTTIVELEEAFVKFRNDDPDKDGKKNTYALSNPSDWSGKSWFQSIFGAYGANPFIWVERDGKLQFGATTPEVKEALKLLNKWYEMELIDPEFITDKGRVNDSEDIATKFAKGKLGYLDHLAYDDHQWDNDGHINYRWVANNPEWKKFFEDNKNDPQKAYSTEVLTDFNDNLPQPTYISMPPVKGPNGQSGYYSGGYLFSVMAFGKQLEDQPEKLEKLLKMLDYMHSDEETYIKLGWGPEGIQWFNQDGERMFNPEFSKHALYNNLQTKLGLHFGINPMYFTSMELIGAVGGPRSKQRFESTAEPIKKYPAYGDKLDGVLPSQSKYSELVDTRIKEYVVKAVAGDIDIDKTFDAMVNDWYKDGGDILTKEANDWYASNK